MTIIDAQIAEGEKFLAHHGVLGMHWGVIRDRAAAGNRGAQKKLAKGDKSWEKELNSRVGFIKVNNRMADYLNGPNGGFAKLNARHPDDVDYTKDSPATRKYFADAAKVQNDAFAKSVKDIYGESPSGSKKAIVVIDPKTRAPHVEIVDANAQHSDVSNFHIPLKTDAKGRIIGISLTPKDTSFMHTDLEDLGQDFLAHHGVLGMHWGKHKAGTSSGASPKTDREARKDAEEFTKAKAYYGEGAGTRRKLIKMKVQGKSAKDPEYKQAFEHHVANTDFSKRAQQARGQRHRTDVKNTTKKTGKGIIHIIRGNPQYASIGAAGLVAGAAFVHKRGYDKIAITAIKNAVKNFG